MMHVILVGERCGAYVTYNLHHKSARRKARSSKKRPSRLMTPSVAARRGGNRHFAASRRLPTIPPTAIKAEDRVQPQAAGDKQGGWSVSLLDCWEENAYQKLSAIRFQPSAGHCRACLDSSFIPPPSSFPHTPRRPPASPVLLVSRSPALAQRPRPLRPKSARICGICGICGHPPLPSALRLLAPSNPEPCLPSRNQVKAGTLNRRRACRQPLQEPVMGSRRTRIRASSITTTAPASRSETTAGRLSLNNRNTDSVDLAPQRNRIREGRRARRIARIVPKSVS
jgi:hypothetical protein